jgi:hypothetical protein
MGIVFLGKNWWRLEGNCFWVFAMGMIWLDDVFLGWK